MSKKQREDKKNFESIVRSYGYTSKQIKKAFKPYLPKGK